MSGAYETHGGTPASPTVEDPYISDLEEAVLGVLEAAEVPTATNDKVVALISAKLTTQQEQITQLQNALVRLINAAEGNTGFITSRERINRPTGEEWWQEELKAACAALSSTQQGADDGGNDEPIEQPDFLYFECPECSFDSVQPREFKGSHECPLCAGDSGHSVSMNMRVARESDKPEGKDARTTQPAQGGG